MVRSRRRIADGNHTPAPLPFGAITGRRQFRAVEPVTPWIQLGEEHHLINPDYFDRFANLAIERDEGVLTIRFHTDGGVCIFTGQTHEDVWNWWLE